MAKSQPKSTKSTDDQADIQSLVKRLDAILDWFESDDIDIQQALKKYQTGLEYVAKLEAFVKSAKIKVDKINRKFE